MEAFEKLEKSTTTDNIWMYILSVLNKSPVHAYAMPDKIKQKFGWKPELITLYVVLYRIEGEGLITSATDGRKKVYKITEKGKAELKRAKALLRKTANAL
ncbi:MAG: helix-turn-helix transcriptional regulator [Candidatus Micrarchaeia archaeon]